MYRILIVCVLAIQFAQSKPWNHGFLFPFGRNTFYQNPPVPTVSAYGTVQLHHRMVGPFIYQLGAAFRQLPTPTTPSFQPVQTYGQPTQLFGNVPIQSPFEPSNIAAPTNGPSSNSIYDQQSANANFQPPLPPNPFHPISGPQFGQNAYEAPGYPQPNGLFPPRGPQFPPFFGTPTPPGYGPPFGPPPPPPNPTSTTTSFISSTFIPTNGPVNYGQTTQSPSPFYGVPAQQQPQSVNGPQLPVASYPTRVVPLLPSTNTYLPPAPTATVYQVGTTPSLDSSTPNTSDSETVANEVNSQTASTRLPTTPALSALTSIESGTTTTTVSSTKSVSTATEPSRESTLPSSTTTPSAESSTVTESESSPQSTQESDSTDNSEGTSDTSSPAESASTVESTEPSETASESNTTIQSDGESNDENEIA